MKLHVNKFLTFQLDFINPKENSFSMDTKEIVGVLMDSPLYFNIPVKERKEMVNHIANEVEKLSEKQCDKTDSTMHLKLSLNVKYNEPRFFFDNNLKLLIPLLTFRITTGLHSYLKKFS